MEMLKYRLRWPMKGRECCRKAEAMFRHLQKAQISQCWAIKDMGACMEKQAESIEEIAPQATRAVPTKVLIVEDEAVVAMHLRHELTKLGYLVAGTATQGEQALKMVEEVFPDVILMDIHIQGTIDGIETAKRIPRYLHIPVIYLTAYSEDTTLKRAGDTRPYGYLIKPFLDRELHATIKIALERSRADEAIRENESLLFRALCTTPISEC
jgi:CheY-like chemotaxis protein